MSRNYLVVLLVAGLLVPGCSKQPHVKVKAELEVVPEEREHERERPVLVERPVAGTQPPVVVREEPAVPVGLVELSVQERYDAALLDALNLVADRRYGPALTTLEAARALKDGDQVRAEIAKVKGLLEQQAVLEKTTRDIQDVLAQGKADEAARLGTTALAQFGGNDACEDLGKLKRQADALVLAPVDDAATRSARCLAEARAALQDQNLRAAAIAYEQALQIQEDPEARRGYDEVRAALSRYDDARNRAAQLRREPAGLEGALAALQEARKAWDTPQVRLDIEEYTLALQKRRDRLSVAEFEVRGEVGLPQAGRTVAEELLPAFKARFDLVERGQLGKVVEELRLEAANLGADPQGCREVGRLARLRYLVVGSLTTLCGVTAQARLVDVGTGLVVQTASVSAPTVEALLPRLPLLGQMLQMTDEQKIAFAQAQQQQAAPVAPIPVDAPLPPPPPPFVAGQPPPPPIVAFNPRPPALGGLVLADFQNLPAVVVAPPPPPAEVLVVADPPLRRRFLSLSLELGDNLFRRGRHREAQRQFQLALNFTNDQADVQIRIDRCRPFLPPPPPPPVVVAAPPVIQVPSAPAAVVVAPPVYVLPPPVVRPRLVVFNFLVNCDPGLVPVGFGDWAADHCGSYFGTTYEVIDRGEVCWYMGRLGITVRDVLTNPSARVALTQALNVRFFLYGAVQQTASLNVETHLIDAQTGAHTGLGTIHVQDANELKLRMNELARQTGAAPSEQAVLAQKGKVSEKVLNEARQLQKAGQHAQAAAVARKALQDDPNNTALQALLQQSEQQARQETLEQTARQEAQRRQAEAEAARKKQADLVRQAEAARQKADQEARVRTEAAKQEQAAQKQRAADRLRAEGQQALTRGAYAQAVQSLQAAVALVPSETGFKELALARARADEAARTKAAEEKARQEAQARAQREAAQARLEAERRRRDAEEAARQKAQKDRDHANVVHLTDQARQLLARQQYEAALAAVHGAQQLEPANPEVEALAARVRDEQAQAAARKKGQEAERKLAEEKAQRDKAEAEARRNQETYLRALQAAQKAMADKRYDEAAAQFQAAAKVYRTDVALNGLHQAEEFRAREKASQEAAQRQKAEADKRGAQVAALMTEGRKALDAGKYDQAIGAFRQAGQLAPGNVEALTLLGKAEHARDEAQANAKRQAEADQKMAAFRKAMDSGKARLAARQYGPAAQAFREALQLRPGDPEATAALRDAEKAGDAMAGEETRQREQAARVQQWLAAARKSTDAREWDSAAKALSEASKLAPRDPAVQKAVDDLDRARKAAAMAGNKQRQADYELALAAGRDALKKQNYQGAVNSFKEALRLMPGDATAAGFLKEADRLLQEASATQQAEARRREELNRLVAQGQAAMAAKKYADAVQAFTAAARLQPGDAGIAKALKEAQQALDASKAPPPPNPRAEYAKQMQAAATAEKQKKWAEAFQAYKEALRWVPNDPKAAAGLKNADFNNHMTEGQKLHAAKKYTDAAKEFEAALKLLPDNADAKAALKKAKDMKP